MDRWQRGKEERTCVASNSALYLLYARSPLQPRSAKLTASQTSLGAIRLVFSDQWNLLYTLQYCKNSD